MNKSSTKWYSIISGTVFLLLLFIFFVLVPCPSDPQLNFFRIVIALAAGGFAATIPGTFNIKKTWLKATSSLGIFALVFLVNPAGWKNSDCNLRNLKATVYIDNNLTQGVEIIIPDIGQRFFTDEFGNANIEFSSSQIRFPTTIIFKYKSEVDTSFQLDAFDNKMEFRLISKKVGISSFQEGSFTYSYKDLTLNISLINEILPKTSESDNELSKSDDESDSEDQGEDIANYIFRSDTVIYSLKKKADTIFITPNSKLLDLLSRNQPVQQFDYLLCKMCFPELDIKFTNNSNEAIFLNKITLQVEGSVPNNDAIFIPWSGLGDVSFVNVGWGSAKDIFIDFSTSSKLPAWDKPFEERVIYKTWDTVEVKTLQDEIYRNLVKKGVDEQYLKEGGFNIGSSDTIKEKEKKGEFIYGAYVYGTITFSDQTHQNKVQKFENFMALAAWPGGAVEDFSSKHTTELKVSGENYDISIPLSNSLKPKGFERMALGFSSAQSSSHCFYLTFHYNDKEYKIPNPFKLEYFIRADMKEYFTTEK